MNRNTSCSQRAQWITAAASSVLALAATTSAVHATTIGINIQGTGDSLASTTTAGVIPGVSWNNFTGSALSLTDSSGASGAGSLTMMSLGGSGSAAYTYAGTNGDYELNSGARTLISNSSGFTFNGSINSGGTGAGTGSPLMFSVSGLGSAYTSGGYSVYIYYEMPNGYTNGTDEFGLDAGGTITTLSSHPDETVSGTDYYQYGKEDGYYSGAYVATPYSSTSTGAGAGDYVVFSGLAASNFTVGIEGLGGDSFPEVSAIEIVPTPEPASLGIMSLLGATLLRRRRR